MRKFILIVIGALSTLMIGYYGPGESSTAFARQVAGVIGTFTGNWSKEACVANPLACLSSRQRELATLQVEFDRNIDALEIESKRVEMIVTDRRRVLDTNLAFLEQGRRLLQKNPAATGYEFAGRQYQSANELQIQLKTLFAERQRLQTILADAKKLQSLLVDRSRELISRRGEVTVARQMLPTQIELLKSKIALKDLDQNAQTVSDLIDTSVSGLRSVGRLIGSTEDLVRRQQQAGSTQADESEFREFMSGGTRDQ